MNRIKAAKLNFAHLPTPLERLDRLSRHMGGPTVWLKRDDCTGLSFGGNKARKLEYILKRALETGADTIITCGALQSNHARQTAAISARLGFQCYVLLRDNALVANANYRRNGNLLLDRLHDAKVIELPADADLAAQAVALRDTLRAEGRAPFVIPGGGANLEGTLAYVEAAMELDLQMSARALRAREIVLAVGTGGTLAGVVAGVRLLNSATSVLGISVGPTTAEIEPTVRHLVQEAARHLDLETHIHASDIRIDDRFLGGGYGVLDDAVREAMSLLARLEGIVLDPVYTAKAMGGMLHLIREGRYVREDHVVFIHTGGGPGVFAYEGELLQGLNHVTPQFESDRASGRCNV